MTQYQLFSLRQVLPWDFPTIVIALIYIGALKTHMWKRALLAAPSIILFVLPLITVLTMPELGARRGYGDVWGFGVFIAYLVAASLVVFNAFYVRTHLHWLQIVNIACAVVTIAITGMAVSGDWL